MIEPFALFCTPDSYGECSRDGRVVRNRVHECLDLSELVAHLSEVFFEGSVLAVQCFEGVRAYGFDAFLVRERFSIDVSVSHIRAVTPSESVAKSASGKSCGVVCGAAVAKKMWANSSPQNRLGQAFEKLSKSPVGKREDEIVRVCVNLIEIGSQVYRRDGQENCSGLGLGVLNAKTVDRFVVLVFGIFEVSEADV